MRNVDVNREGVLGLIKTAEVPLTSKEMARILKVKERSVRAAVVWLIKGGFVKSDGFIVSSSLLIVKNKTFRGKRKIYMYIWTGKTSEVKKLSVKGMSCHEITEANKDYSNVNFLQSLIMKMR